MKYLVIPVLLTALLAGCQSTSQSSSTVYQGTDPSQRKRDKSELAQARTALAGQFIAQRQLDAAKRQLDEALEADSRYAPAYDMMGNLLRIEGSPSNVAKADEYFKKAISLDPNFTQARNNYGVYLSERGRYQEAIEQFNIAGGTLGYRNRAGALENLGLTYLKMNNPAAAEAAFNKAMETERGTVVAKMEMIDILINRRESLKAKEYFEDLKSLSQMHGQPMPPRLIYQGIRLNILQNNRQEIQRLSSQLLSQYPLSDEAKKLKQWLNNSTGALK
ncbi:type IV pilus biogenesis/stability protein PilW [Moraxella bovis]|uniref:type IV pilus biogenesis/stability protein PilW n=1 Tax=Moraxella bovis TaxID=476 RepID=UPI0009919BF8|nr:type IV pilus biogenesis/stability protein PilW [Moraxella bovis]AWY19757.1 type IV pilus biogenesis/stability protein PilW [Moraxella bovis]OOR91958.1 type IV pilus biogenesis/stability protein PilW [Moraxella bovis]UYZ67878.1 type IV pilus biogenesis/stability protein PilW [Moraxella bovis]UYZ73837.1 type IV pilus biogenesis/stability protein PilW [Moraxella bovis]UYZ80459.1 type IV pilus biogenesis/stability protein PilW [Moraxella bovis]